MKSWNVLLKQLLLSYFMFNEVVKLLTVSDLTHQITDTEKDNGSILSGRQAGTVEGATLLQFLPVHCDFGKYLLGTSSF